MAPKRRNSYDDKILKKHRFIFKSNSKNYISFATNVFAHSAMRFYIPENCVSVLNDSKNNFGCPNFYLVATRNVIFYQLLLRYELYDYFQTKHQSNKLDSLDRICEAFHGAVERRREAGDYTVFVEKSLSIGCELILFLYSIESPLYVTALAKYWFKYLFCEVKKIFEDGGGMNLLHGKASHGNCGRSTLDDKHDEFISQNCRSYKTSAENLQTQVNFLNSLCEGHMDTNFFLEELMKTKEKIDRESLTLKYAEKPDVSVPVLTSKPDKVSGLDVPKHEDLLRTDGGLVAETSPFQDLLPTSSRKPVGRHKKTSGQHGRQTRGEAFSSVEQGLGQSSLDTSRPSISKNPSLAIPQPEDSLRSLGDPVAENPPQNFPGLNPKKPVRRRKETSAQLDRRNGENISSKLEQDLAQLSSDQFEDLLRRFRDQLSKTPVMKA